MINIYLPYQLPIYHLWYGFDVPSCYQKNLKIKMWCDLSSYVTLSVFIQLDISENQVEFK